MSELDINKFKYNVRSVAPRQVYDSYMGILRISPNNNEDDPTTLLETIDEEIKLSDSNGTKLPITFIPKAFGKWINIQTKVDDNVYVTKTFTSRSTLKLSKMIILNNLKEGTTNGILIYPTIRPSSNDTDYFNYNNIHKFWEDDYETWVIDQKRHEKVEKKLLEQKLSWYNDTSKVKEVEKVKVGGQYVDGQYVGGQYVTQTNNHGEEVPILYTHDYILGVASNGTTTNELPTETINDKNVSIIKDHVTVLKGNCTRLSWERIDKIIWENLDTYLNYRDDMDDRFSDISIFDKGTTYQAEPSKVLSGKDTSKKEEQKWRANAPLLARGVQDGIIMYHAMPFNRYWFHRCRQVLTNMEISDPEWAKIDINKTSVQFPKWDDIDDPEKQQLSQAKWAKLITAASKASLTPHHSLVKDYLLCNGKEVTVKNFVKNFPNINLKNYNLFNISQKGAYAAKDTNTNKYNVIDYSKTTYEGTTHYAVYEGTTHYSVFESLSKKLPDLFNFTDFAPRFIRGLNFSFNNGSSYIISDEVKFGDGTQDTQNRVDTLAKSSSNFIMGYSEKDLTSSKDILGKASKYFSKEITDVSECYDSSFDYLDKKWKHYHLLFSSDSSTRSKIDNTRIAETLKSNEGSWARIKLDNSKNILFENVYKGDLPDSWLQYCFCDSNGKMLNNYFSSFQPIPTAGLILLSNVNTNKNIITWRNYYYNDAEGNLHSLSEKYDEKQLKIKMNEADGIWPISYSGKASFSMFHNHTWRRKRTSTFKKRWDWEHGSLYKYDVGKYTFHGITGIDDGTLVPKNCQINGTPVPTNSYIWRTMTSLPLINCHKLACGDLSKFNSSVYKDKDKISPSDPDYYTYHNVTDQWRESKKFTQTNDYNGIGFKTEENIPFPSHINLLPLIKL